MSDKKWISWWFAFSAVVMSWDSGYLLLRPRSMAGGDLYWLWKPYTFYEQVDYVYSVQAYENGEGFAGAQAVMNLIENFVGLSYVFATHISKSDLAPLIGYSAATMTTAKTILYVAQELFCGFCAVGHNELSVIVKYWAVPNLLWFTVACLIMYTLGKDISLSLRRNKAAANKLE
ncbi:hypothetical protein D9758_008538 [Tetrapyrgos nigripes]|uniref:EXPERA domain-containing protein n=1 Tax=Tetrapyrgos nigripes TaxID=182062 RepID=A0A8H5G5J3_9AGAR|nr:hypothetical protein D9758_008538 [Tetrapyrgos nigripes]